MRFRFLPSALPRPTALCSAALLGASLANVPGPASAADRVYRCTGGDGRVSFQAQPCAGSPLPARPAQPQPQPFYLPEPAPPAAAPRGQPGPQAAAASVAAPSTPETKTWAAGADVVVVSGYTSSSGMVQVDVDHRARPVLLVLTSYDSVPWKVVPGPGTRIKAVVAAVRASNGRPEVLAPPGVPVQVDQLPYAYETQNLNFRELLKGLNARYGVERVLALRGAYNLPGRVTVNGPFVPDSALSLGGLRPEAPALRFDFDLVSVDGRRLPFSNTGPRDGKRYNGIVRGGVLSGLAGAAVVREDGREAYYLEGNGGTLVWAPEGMGGRKEKILLPPHLPPLSWGTGLAWDTRKGVLAIVSFGGEGFFYRYDTRRRQWMDARSLQNRDLMSLSLDAKTGGYVAISQAVELVRFNERGELEDVQPLKDLLPDLGSTYDRGNRRPEGLHAVASGPACAVVNIGNGSVTHIWTYDERTRKAQLTYKAE